MSECPEDKAGAEKDPKQLIFKFQKYKNDNQELTYQPVITGPPDKGSQRLVPKML